MICVGVVFLLLVTGAVMIFAFKDWVRNFVYSLLALFLARDSMLSVLYAIANPSVRLSVCPSVCPSHRWISRKRLKLGSCNFHHTVAPSL